MSVLCAPGRKHAPSEDPRICIARSLGRTIDLAIDNGQRSGHSSATAYYRTRLL